MPSLPGVSPRPVSCASPAASHCTDPDSFDRVFRELDQPVHHVDVGAALEQRDHRDALVRSWAVHQATQTDQLLRESTRFQDQVGHVANDRIFVVQVLEQHVIGQNQATLRE